jgi:hypothetical protein
MSVFVFGTRVHSRTCRQVGDIRRCCVAIALEVPVGRDDEFLAIDRSVRPSGESPTLLGRAISIVLYPPERGAA